MDQSYLNSVQIRAQTIKDDLKNVDLEHLHSFLDGVSDPEPPHYRKVLGKVEPKFEKVTLKEGANLYKVGNVIFSQDQSTQYVEFAVEDGKLEAYLSDALPKDSRNGLSTPILDSTMVELLPLWEAKFQAIKRRMVQINDVRFYTHNLPNLPEQKLTLSENMAKLMTGNIQINIANSRKRGSTEPVLKHPANKRKRIGLQSVPDPVKCDIFHSIPDHFKIELFNLITRAAFPGFENVLMASWNVVSIYEHVGGEFPGFHKAITELKSVLQDFDATYREQRLRARAVKEESQERIEKPRPHEGAPEDERVNQEEGPDFMQTRRDMEAVEDSEGTELVHTQLPKAPPEETTNSNGLSPEPFREPQFIPATSSREDMVAKDHSKSSMSARSSHSAPQYEDNSARRSIERMTADDMKKQEYRARIRDTQAQLSQIHPAMPNYRNETGSARPTLEEQRNGGRESHPRKSQDQYGRPTDNGRGDPNGAKSMQLPSSRYPYVREYVEPIDANGSDIRGSEEHKNNQLVFLGQSKLGRPKPIGNGKGIAPEAPMLHNFNKDQHVTGHRRV